MWANDIFSVENKFSLTKKPLSAKVFLSIGELENEKDKLTLQQFESSLTKYPGVKTNLFVFPNESHISIIPAMISRTMKVLFPKKE